MIDLNYSAVIEVMKLYGVHDLKGVFQKVVSTFNHFMSEG